MAIAGKNRHYKIVEISGRHWYALALRVGGEALWDRMRRMVESVNAAIDRTLKDLPRGFPEKVSTTITAGVREQARKFLNFVPAA